MYFIQFFLVVESRSRFRSFFLLGFRRFSYFPIAFRVRDGCGTVFTFRFFLSSISQIVHECLRSPSSFRGCSKTVPEVFLTWIYSFAVPKSCKCTIWYDTSVPFLCLFLCFSVSRSACLRLRHRATGRLNTHLSHNDYLFTVYIYFMYCYLRTTMCTCRLGY